MRRREFISLICGVAAWPLAARAQQPPLRMRKIGILGPLRESDAETGRRLAALSQGLRELGWAEGHNITFEKRFSDGNPQRLPALATELVKAGVDVIVTNGSEPVEALRSATSTIPIVMASVGDAVGAGYVSSLAHPGGNITGMTLVATDQGAKRLQLIKELSPAIARVAVLSNADSAGHRLQLKEMESAAAKLGVTLQSLAVHDASDIEAAFRTAVEANTQAIVTMDDPLIQSQRQQVVEFGLRQRVPVMGEFRPTTDAGAVMSYGPNQIDMWRRAAVFVDKILKGANPADLPIERPTKFQLVINLKSAKAIGLPVPATLLVAADEIIE
jgi:putative tryptophan/tyrosine transport system substrate-binding protein